MVIEVVMLSVQHRCIVDFEQGLPNWVIFPDTPIVHFPHLPPGVVEGRLEHRVLHESHITRLAGDDVQLDQIEQLLIALQRSGYLTRVEMVLLQASYLRETRP